MASVFGLRAAADDAAVGRLRTEAAPAWEEYQKFAARLQGSLTTERRDVLNRRTLSTAKSEFRQRDGSAVCVSIISDPVRRTTQGQVYAENPEYEFELRQSDGRDEWLLKGYGQLGTYHDRQQWYRVPADMVRQGVARNLYVEYKHLSLLLDDPGFTVTRVGPAPDSALVKVELSYDSRARLLNNERLIPFTGYVVLDPAKDWTVRMYDIVKRYADGGKARVVVTIDTKATPSGRHIVERVARARTGTTASGPFEQEIVTTYDLHEDPEPSEEAFTLSSFGLPEPVGTTRRAATSALTYWLLGGAGILGGLAVACWYAAKRKARNS